MKKANVYQKITNVIIDQLHQGKIPWRKPWKSFYPRNYISKNLYHGLNFILLTTYNFPSNFFMTFNQCRKLKGNVIKGSKGIPIIFWKILKTTYTAQEIAEGMPKRFPYIRYSTVFNLSQTSLWENDAHFVEPPKLPEAEEFFNSLSFVPEIRHERNRAFYSLYGNYINVPPLKDFLSSDEYFAALFHELIHSTGHSSRLNRFENPKQFNKDSHAYSFEELIAELGSAFLCSMCGIDNTLQNSAAYIQGWLTTFENDEKMIIKASTKAKAAVKFLINKADEKATEKAA